MPSNCKNFNSHFPSLILNFRNNKNCVKRAFERAADTLRNYQLSQFYRYISRKGFSRLIFTDLLEIPKVLCGHVNIFRVYSMEVEKEYKFDLFNKLLNSYILM